MSSSFFSTVRHRISSIVPPILKRPHPFYTTTSSALFGFRFLSSNNVSGNDSSNHHKLIIIGSGPAGLTAALYASRANLYPLVIEGHESGGQLMTTTDVENFPGFPDGIMGPDLIENMKNQSQKFGTKFVFDNIDQVNFNSKPYQLISNFGKKTYYADSIIISTGASAKYLGLPKEKELIGHGVSACATCDGFFFKNKVIAVVGGGDSACEESTFLTKFASKVYLIHRRDKLRASKIMQQKVFDNDKIEVIWNNTVIDVIGSKTDGVKGLKLKNTQNGNESELNVSGLFLAIGHTPNTDAFKGSLSLDDNGYIVVKPGTVETNVDGIFACGDVQDTKYKQAITAAGTGCMAAMDAEKYLEQMEHESKSKL